MTERENAASRPEALKQKPSHPKRFYEHVAIKDEGDGVGAFCSTARRCARPARRRSSCRTRRWREAIAEEWRGQGARIDPQTMPLTRLANSVIDGVKGNEGAVIDDILKYAGSDLLCYRAEGPKGLVALQSKHWDPILAWAKHDLGAQMRLSEGVMHVEQPPTSLDALKKRLQEFDPWSLAALHVMTGLSGSALLALRSRSAASRRRRLGPPPMSMKTGRSANGARTRRRKCGARTATATSPPPRGCSTLLSSEFRGFLFPPPARGEGGRQLDWRPGWWSFYRPGDWNLTPTPALPLQGEGDARRHLRRTNPMLLTVIAASR